MQDGGRVIIRREKVKSKEKGLKPLWIAVAILVVLLVGGVFVIYNLLLSLLLLHIQLLYFLLSDFIFPRISKKRHLEYIPHYFMLF